MKTQLHCVTVTSEQELRFYRQPRHLRVRMRVLAAACLLAVRVLGAGPAPPEVLQAARNGLPGFWASAPAGTRESLGFAPDTEFVQLRLEAPLQVHTILPAALADSKRNSSISSLLSETTLWYFPVCVGSEVKAMLVVDRMPDGWQAVSFGYAPLGREWNEVWRQWPVAKGYTPKLIAVFSAQQYLFTVPQVDDQNLTVLAVPGAPVQRGRPPDAGVPRYSTLAPLSQAVQGLKASLQTIGGASTR